MFCRDLHYFYATFSDYDKQMKILVISPYHPALNSMIAECEATIGLAKRGVEVSVMTPRKSDCTPLYEKNSIEVIDFEPKQKIDFDAIKFIRKLIKERRYDLIYLIRGKGISNGIAASYGLPIKVVTYLGSTSFYWHDPSALLTHLNPRVDKIVCLSRDVERHLHTQLISKRKTRVIHKGYNPQWISDVTPIDLEPFGIPKGSFVVSCLARKSKVKGIEYLINAVQYLPKDSNIHIVIVGGSIDSEMYQKLKMSSPEASRIHLIGFRADAIRYIAASQLYVQSSLNEGLGRAIIEAMALGVAPIITDAGGCTELLIDGESGLIVPIKNPKAIADAITKLYNNNKLRLSIGAAAKAHLQKDFSIDKTVDKFYSLFKELVYGE
jgi:L-malate glycosyltransferase